MSRPWVAAPAAPLADAFRLAFPTAASWKHGSTLIFALQDRQHQLTIPAACSDDEVPLQPADSLASEISFPSDTDSISGVPILGPALQAVHAARTWPCSHSHRCCRSRLWRTTALELQGSMIEPRPLKIAMQQASRRLKGSLVRPAAHQRLPATRLASVPAACMHSQVAGTMHVSATEVACYMEIG